jgi:hypothetical protein
MRERWKGDHTIQHDRVSHIGHSSHGGRIIRAAIAKVDSVKLEGARGKLNGCCVKLSPSDRE